MTNQASTETTIDIAPIAHRSRPETARFTPRSGPPPRVALALALALSLLSASLLMFVLVLTAGCESRSPAAEHGQSGAARAQVATPPAQATLDSRSQYDLAQAIASAEKMRRDDAMARLDEIHRDWHGKRYRWKVFVIPSLCASTKRCNVLPFDTGGDDRHIVQGWLPQLTLSADAHQAIRTNCTDSLRCAIEFEGTLSKLVLSTEEFTSLGFDQVEIL